MRAGLLRRILYCRAQHGFSETNIGRPKADSDPPKKCRDQKQSWKLDARPPTGAALTPLPGRALMQSRQTEMRARQTKTLKTAFSSEETIVLAEAYETACDAAERAGVLSSALRVKIAQLVYDTATHDELNAPEIARRATEQLVRPIISG
jgi:hypothetical protein